MVKLLSALCVALTLNSLLGFGFDLGAAYFVAIALVLLALISRGGDFRLDPSMLALHMACVASLAVNEVPSIFRSWERFLAFLVVTSVLSPFITSPTMAQFRVRVFWYLQWSLLAVTGISTVLYLFGLPGFDPAYYSGLTSHSMLMGPVAACSALFALFLMSKAEYRSRRAFRVLLWCLLSSALLAVIVSSSRAAIAALLISFCFGVLYYRKHLANAVFYGLVAVLAASLLLFQWGELLTEGIARKSTGSSILAAESRDHLWTQRIEEFQSNPYLGIGFGAVDVTAGGGSVYSDDGRVETGSSWLAIASMLGLLGCIAFLLIVARSIHSLKRIGTRGNEHSAGYLGVLLVFWAVHMVAEGYILAAGSFLFVNVWLVMGVVGALDGYPELDLPPAQ